MSILHTPAPWDVRDTAGEGWQVRGKLMLIVNPQVGRVSLSPFWRLPKIPIDPILNPETGELSGVFAYEERIRFPMTPDFEAMQKANAHLISAAPDLLTELKALVARVGCHPEVVPFSAHAAIAKAEAVTLSPPPTRTFPQGTRIQWQE